MVKHIVCFKLRDSSPAACEEARQILLSMKGKVPDALDIAADVDFLHSERSYDLLLTVLVKDKEALTRYQNDPYHCDVVKPYMHRVRTDNIALDAEL